MWSGFKRDRRPGATGELQAAAFRAVLPRDARSRGAAACEVPDDQLRHLVEEGLAAQDVRAMQNRRVRQGLDGVNQHERGELEVARTERGALLLEVAACDFLEQPFQLDHVLLAPGVRHLFHEDPVQLGLDRMGVEHRAHHVSSPAPQGAGPRAREPVLEGVEHLLDVPLEECGDDRLLAGKVLVERSDAHTSPIGDAVGARRVVPLPYENASGRGEDGLDRGLGALLLRSFSRDHASRRAHRGAPSKDASRKCESSLISCYDMEAQPSAVSGGGVPSRPRGRIRPHDWAAFVAVTAGLLALGLALWGHGAWGAGWGVVALVAAASARVWSQRRPGPMPHLGRWTLLMPRGPLSPARLRTVLQPQDGERVLEVGPGIGIYSLPIAAALAPSGVLDVVDVQAEMLADLLRRTRRARLRNVVATHADARRLPYPDATFDAAYLISVLGEIPGPSVALRELRRVLKPGGRLIVGEFLIDPDFTSVKRLQELAASAGFALRKVVGPRVAYFALFRVEETLGGGPGQRE